MKLLVRCRCETWILDETEIEQVAHSVHCRVCHRLTLWSFDHVGRLPKGGQEITLDAVRGGLTLHTDESSVCMRESRQVIEGQRTWRVTPNGRRVRELHGRLITHDNKGAVEHIGDYVRGDCTRGLWMHQASGFLAYRSQTSDLQYERGLLSGKRYHALIAPNTEVLSPTRYQTLRRRLLRKFSRQAIVGRKRIHWRPMDEQHSDPSSDSGSQSL